MDPFEPFGAAADTGGNSAPKGSSDTHHHVVSEPTTQ
jgi:hypothetical protein